MTGGKDDEEKVMLVRTPHHPRVLQSTSWNVVNHFLIPCSRGPGLAMSSNLILIILLFTVMEWAIAGKPRLREDHFLLPYKTNTSTSVILIIDGSGGACFHWKSSRPNVATVTPIDGRESDSDCSVRAVVTAVSRDPRLESAVIHAKDSTSGLILTATIEVDVIHRHELRYYPRGRTIKKNACQSEYQLAGFNSQDKKFTHMDGLQVQWGYIQATLHDKESDDEIRNECDIPIEGYINEEWSFVYRVRDTGHPDLDLGIAFGNDELPVGLVDIYEYPDLSVTTGPAFRPWTRSLTQPSFVKEGHIIIEEDRNMYSVSEKGWDITTLSTGEPHLREDYFLMPYRSDISTSAILFIDDADGGCFHWKSSRPDVATVTPIDGLDTDSDCSTQAVVTAVSQSPELESVVIQARDSISGLVLTANVDVDNIHQAQVARQWEVSKFRPSCHPEFHVTFSNRQDKPFTHTNGLEIEWGVIQVAPHDSQWKDEDVYECEIPITGSTTGGWRVIHRFPNSIFDEKLRRVRVLEAKDVNGLVDVYLYPKLTLITGPVFRLWDKPVDEPSFSIKRTVIFKDGKLLISDSIRSELLTTIGR